jgi:tape measure domain-containing protein
MNPDELASLVVRLGGDTRGLTSALSQAESAMDKSGGAITSSANKMEAGAGAAFTRFAGIATTAIAGVTGAVSAFSAVKSAFSLAAEAEENEIAFGVMLGNAEKGKQMVADLQKFAAQTPLDTSTLQQASKTLLQFGLAGEDILPTLKMIGDVTGGNAEKVRSMAVVFGQMASTGKLMGQDLLQMINNGFNPLQIMAQKLADTIGGDVNTHMVDLKKKMEQGQISLEMVKEAFASASGEGGKFAGLMEKQANSISGLISTMQDDLSAFLRSVGKDLIEGLDIKNIVKDVSGFFQNLSGWFNGLSKHTKMVIASIVAATVAVSALAAGILAAGAIVTAIAAVTAVTAGIVVSLGGVGETLKKIRDWGTAAWEWLEPARKALASLFNTVMEVGAEAWEYLKQVAVDAWAFISGNAQVNWEKVKEGIVDAILIAEFSIKNFGKVTETVWAGIKYGVVALGGFIVYYFQNSTEIAWRAFKGLFDSLSNAVKNIDKILKGEMSFADLWKPMKDELGKLPDREIGETEKRLKKEFEAMSGSLRGSWDDFRAKKLAEFAKVDTAEAEKEAEKTGKKVGKGVTKGAAKEIKKLDAVLFDSLEGIFRYTEYLDKLKGKTATGAMATGGAAVSTSISASTPSGPNPNPVKVTVNQPASGQAQGEREVLIDIRNILDQMNKKPTVTVQKANF